MNKDEEQLNLLKTFYYIFGGISAVFYFLTIFIFGLGVAMLTGAIVPDEPAAKITEMGLSLTLVGGFVFIYGFGTSVATILVGKFIKDRKNHLFCLILAALNCLSFPLGTALGVFTFVVLLRDSVKKMFGKD